MHYLTELAEKLANAYEECENLREWLSPEEKETSRKGKKVSALRCVLEQAVADGSLSYNRIRFQSNARKIPRAECMLTGFASSKEA